jgi:TrmH family RNA methyltransferase
MLTSLKNPKIASAARLRKRTFREEERRFLVEGAQGVQAGLDAQALEAVFTADVRHPIAVRASQAHVPVHHVSDEVLHRLTSTVTPQGILATARFVDVPPDHLSTEGCLVVLHEVRDPGNAGTVVRSADAAGASGVVFTASSVDVYNSKTVRASAGSVFHVPLVRGPDTVRVIEGLRAEGVRVLAMDAHGPESLYDADLESPVAFLFGNEAHGLAPDVAQAADATVRVPISGAAESLNLAAAATVCLFEWSRRRTGPGRTLETVIASAAHDIRSPLTAMKGFGYALERQWDTMSEEQRATMLQGIVHDADRMDLILRQLVDAARLEAGSLAVQRETTDLSELVAGIADVRSRDPDLPPVLWEGEAGPFFVDRVRLRTSLMSFLESLVWWADEGPIEVVAERRDDRLMLRASRAGSVVDAAGAEELFRPRAPGTGAGSKIGLYVARGVAESLGGRVWAEVRDGRLVFVLELPLAT